MRIEASLALFAVSLAKDAQEIPDVALHQGAAYEAPQLHFAKDMQD
jgi:hypothetical protein